MIFREGNSRIIKIHPEEFDFFKNFLRSRKVNWTLEQQSSLLVVLSLSLTGYIQTPLRKIELLPKYKELTIDHIIRLYNFVYNHNSASDDKLLDLSKGGQSDRLIEQFLNGLESNIFQGVDQTYKNILSRNDYLVGRVNFPKTYKNMLHRKPEPVVTRSFKLSIDTPINRIIVGALEKIKSSPKYSTKANHLLSYFYNVKGIESEAGEYVQKIVFNSHNNRFQKIVATGAIIIDSLYYNHSRGSEGGESFIVNFDNLFEKFIQKILLLMVKDSDFTVLNAPNTLGKEYEDNYFISSKKYKPDLVFGYLEEDLNLYNEPSAKVVLDVKNKAYNVFSNSDIYQINLYSQILNAKQSILIYPSFKERLSKVFYITNSEYPFSVFNDIYAVFINIAPLDGEDFLDAIQLFIKKIYEIIDA